MTAFNIATNAIDAATHHCECQLSLKMGDKVKVRQWPSAYESQYENKHGIQRENLVEIFHIIGDKGYALPFEHKGDARTALAYYNGPFELCSNGSVNRWSWQNYSRELRRIAKQWYKERWGKKYDSDFKSLKGEK